MIHVHEGACADHSPTPSRSEADEHVKEIRLPLDVEGGPRWHR